LILGLLGVSWGFIGNRAMFTTSVGWVQNNNKEISSPISAASMPDLSTIIAQLPRSNTGVNQTNWDSPQYVMLLITPPQIDGFIEAAEGYAAWKTIYGIILVIPFNTFFY
jgi:hypothetical protein